MASDLPIVEVLPALRQSLRTHRNVVLQAPPGAGKSTRVPLELLDEPWARNGRLIMLEPRRLATRAVAARMAQTLGEPVGQTVGYRMRLDSRRSEATRIEVVTEGVLTAMLHDDPALDHVAGILFDEFHERSLQADLGLALCLDVQANLKPDLRLLIMSATLAADAVAKLLHDAPIIRATGRAYPVDVRYLTPAGHARTRVPKYDDSRAIAALVAGGVLRALGENDGDILVFLPGAGEIRRTAALLEPQVDQDVRVLPLLGELDPAAQDLALRPAAAGIRKVVLATNIAETSLTIEGVSTVVDCGLARRSRFDPVRGMSRLETLRISRASAEQRSGRAGRLGPGVCYRLWTEAAQENLEAQTPAEILETDLASLVLELAGWNTTDPRLLRWLDLPPDAHFAQARDLLRALDALDAGGRITHTGRDMLRLSTHPRLANMLLRARALGLHSEACELAALLSERDVLVRSDAGRDADLRTRLEILHGSATAATHVDRAALERVRRLAEQFRRQLAQASSARSASAQVGAADVPGVLLALAYPDRIARRRTVEDGRFLLCSGSGAYFAEPQALARSDYLVIASLDNAEREARIFLAAPISSSALEEVMRHDISDVARIEWNARERAVMTVRERRLGALLMGSLPLIEPEEARVTAELIRGIRQLTLEVLPWDRELRSWQARVQLVRALPARRDSAWPDVRDAALLASLESWLAPRLGGMTRIDHLARLDLGAILEGLLDREQRRRLQELAPTHLAVPSGSRVRIDYLDGDTPSLSVRLQELFGLVETPRIAGGTLPLLIKLLSPAYRPVQVTRDLASFWQTGYAQVRKELKGRYPKHAWPEDPRTAPATRGTRRRA